MTETIAGSFPVASTATVSLAHDCITIQSSASEGGGQGVSLKLNHAVETTPVVSLSVPFKTFKGNVDSIRKLMPRRLDYRLGQVAALRQVSIKTARDWRDSQNKKWAKAISEIEDLRCDQRKKKRQGQVTLPTLQAIRNLPSNHYTKAAIPPRQPGSCEKEILEKMRGE